MSLLHPLRYAVRRLRSLPISTRLALQRMRSSPHSQDISNWLVFSCCFSSPVCGSRFFETAVRTLEWKGWFARFMAPFALVFVCMASMFGLPLFPVHVQLLRSRT